MDEGKMSNTLPNCLKFWLKISGYPFTIPFMSIPIVPISCHFAPKKRLQNKYQYTILICHKSTTPNTVCSFTFLPSGSFHYLLFTRTLELVVGE
ncbi:hypothetical protein EYC80_008939 [Monilinia laxa]|uniref:Uncharacterized protein n=1 Tax=Monilinia laxa TaxID=61186 RepID=A0A5N6K205_MONLA|nr:hypothetical protein EYC80_008939 [Monilinia laxa]